MGKNIAIIGSSGAIGDAFKALCQHQPDVDKIFTFSRKPQIEAHASIKHTILDILDESSIVTASKSIASAQLDMVLVTPGTLHGDGYKPEKALKDIDKDNLQKVYAINTIAPVLIAKHFVPLLKKDDCAVFAVLSARVGSVSDNRLGGWYAYRASKAALNMMIKNISIETQRLYKKMVVVGLHPGTVDSHLSKPFQKNVSKKQLFSPEHAAKLLYQVLEDLKPEDTGKCYDWQGHEVLP